MAELEAIKRALDAAHGAWRTAASPLVVPRPGWTAVFPGIYLEPRAAERIGPTVVVVTPRGQVRARSLVPPEAITDEDRLVFRILERHASRTGNGPLKDALARWVDVHGRSLGGPPEAARSSP